MDYYKFLIFSSFDDLKRNKVRTFLTSLGITIGVFSVVLLIAFGVGLRNYIQNQFENLGSNLIYVLPGRVLSEGGGFQDPGALGPRFDERDLFNLRRISEIGYVVPAYERNITAEAWGKTENSQLLAASEEISKALNLEIEYGRFFTRADVEKRAKTAVIGPKLSTKLYGNPENGVGKQIRLSNQTYRVIGVLKPKGGGQFGGPSFDTISYIPYTAAYSLNPERKIYTFYISAISEKEISELKRKIENILLKRYNEDEFQIVESTELLNVITGIFGILNSILIAIGSISLLVGGIGIMNIMYATVTERIKEIGIRRALGATKSDILYQFLSEAVILSLIGGFLGLILATGAVFAIQPFFPAEIDFLSVIAAIGVSSGIGIFFGVFPARRAANLPPIEAIRYE